MSQEAIEKLLSRVKKLPGRNSCWLWTGPVNRPNGYGWIYLEGKDWATHRAAYNFFVRRIPPGKCVLHKCDVKNCVRPSHLYIGTMRDNARDAVVRGGHPQSKKFKCKRGHIFRGKNLHIRIGRTGMAWRECVSCIRLRNRKRTLKERRNRALSRL